MIVVDGSFLPGGMLDLDDAGEVVIVGITIKQVLPSWVAIRSARTVLANPAPTIRKSNFSMKFIGVWPAK
jgi:hypothetical protein